MTSSTSTYRLLIAVIIFLVSSIPTASAQANCVCPEAGGVSVGVLIGSCLAVLGGTILFEIVGYVAYQKWKKKRLKADATPEPAVAYSPSTTINIDDDGAAPVVRSKSRPGSDSGRSSVYNISETQSITSFFGSSDHGSRGNSIIDTANDFEPLTDTYRIDWKTSTDNLHDDYDVLERAFPILLPKLDAVDFTTARYKSTKINIVPEPQEVVVGVAVEGDRTSRSSSSTRIYKTSSYDGRSPMHHREGKGHGHRSRGQSSHAVVEIEPDRPPVSRQGRIEIDENFSIANSRRSESSDEDLYDYGDTDRRRGTAGSSHAARRGEQRVTKTEKREVLRRQTVDKRGNSLEGSAAMKASGARRAKSLVEGERAQSRSTHHTRASGKAETRGKDYHITNRQVVDGKEVVTLVRADQSQPTVSSLDRGKSRPAGTASDLTRSFSAMDPRQRVSFRDPLESADEYGIPTIGVIHLVDSIDEESGSDVSYRRAPRGRATDRFQKKRVKRSRSESPIKYSERKADEHKRSQQSTSSNLERRIHHSRSTLSSDRNSRNSKPGPDDVPTIGVVRLVSSSPNLDYELEDSTWPRSSDRRLQKERTVSHRRVEETHTRPPAGQRDWSRNKRTVDASTQCEGPKTRSVAVEPRVSWKRLLDEMELILTGEAETLKHRSVGGRMRSTLSRLTSTKKERNGRVQRDNGRRHSLERDGYKDEVTWEELLRDVRDVDDKLDSTRTSGESDRDYRSPSAHSRHYTSKETTRSSRPSSRTVDDRHRSRSMSPVRHLSNANEGKLTTDRSRGQVSRGTHPEVSWGTLLRLMESRIQEKMNIEGRYKKRSPPVVGKFSLKAERPPKAPVTDMGTSPELSWSDFIEIATEEAERNMKSRSVPDLRVAEGPQNIGVFSLKETKQQSTPRRDTGTETDLSYTDLIEIILEELDLIDSERSSSRRSASYDRQRIIDRAKSLGVVHVRSKSEERPRRRDSGTQPDLSWTQVIDIVKEETRRMILRQSKENAMEMGTDPVMPWAELVETILEESADFWSRKNRKRTVNEGTHPAWSWSEIVDIIQEETEEILRLRALSRMESKASQTEKDSSSVAVSTLRTWVRDRPRRVQWEEGTEPQTEWESIVREIEVTAIADYIKAQGLDQPREAPVVSVIKLKKDEQLKSRTVDSATSPIIEWKAFVTEIQEDAIESHKRVVKREQEQQQRIPVAGVFKLKQEEQPTVQLRNSGTNPVESWNDIITEIEEECEEEYKHTIRELQLLVDEYESKSLDVVNTGTQPEWSWDVIVNRIQEETEETIFHHQRIQQQKKLDLMLEGSAQTTVETTDTSSQVEVDVIDKSTEALRKINNVALQVQSRTSETGTLFSQQTATIGTDALVKQVQSVGVTCAPKTTDCHVAAIEQFKETTSSSTQVSPSSVSFGTATDPSELLSKSSQCHVDVSVACVGVKQDTKESTQQTSTETLDQGSMTKAEVAKEVADQGLQVASMLSTEFSQTESILMHDSYAMTDVVETTEVATLAVQEEETIAVQEETVTEKQDPNTETYETWTYLDDFEEPEPILTSVFTHQFGSSRTHEKSTLTAIETRTINTETERAEFDTKHTQIVTEREAKSTSHGPETLPVSTQTAEAVTPTPAMAEKGNQQEQESSEFSQNTIIQQNERGFQASPEERIYHHQATLAKPNTSILSTECDDESDVDSGIDMDCQTPPVMIFSLDEYKEIERDINEYQEMQKTVERMKQEIHQYQTTQQDIQILNMEILEMEQNMLQLQKEISDYQQRQKGMDELRERLKEFEEQEVPELVDAGFGTELISLENDGTQTSTTPVRPWSTQTEINVDDRGTSPITMVINDNQSQTEKQLTREIFTEVDGVTNHSRAIQVTTDARDNEMVTDGTPTSSVALQVAAAMRDTQSQYEWVEEKVAIQTEVSVTNANLASQVRAATTNTATSTEVTEKSNTSTQLSATMIETSAQYESDEITTGTQTIPKQTTDSSTETKAVRIVKLEDTTATQTEPVPVRNIMLDPISRIISEAQIQVDQPPINMSFKVTQTIEKQSDTTSSQTEKYEQEAVTSPHKEVSNLVIQTEDLIMQSTSSQYDIRSTTTVTQTEDNPIQSILTQTEEVKKETEETATSINLEVANLIVQTESVVTESTYAQYVGDVTSSLTQTEREARVLVEDASTHIDISQESSSEQTDEIQTDTRGVQHETELSDIHSQTEIQPTLDTASNTISAQIVDTSAQTEVEKEEQIDTQETQVQFSVETMVETTQTDIISKIHSSSETEEKVVSDQYTGTEVIPSVDAGSQASSDMSDQHSQCEIKTQPLEVQTDLVSFSDANTSARSPLATDNTSTQYDMTPSSDTGTQYQASADHQALQTEEVPVISVKINTEHTQTSTNVTQTESESKPEVTNEITQTTVSRKEFGMTCDLVETKTEKKKETTEASVLHKQKTSLFQSQFNEEKTPQEDVGTIVKPLTSMVGHQVLPETTVFGNSAMPETTDTGTLVSVAEQTDMSSQVSPVSDDKFTQAKTSSVQRALSPVTVNTLSAGTQIDPSPVRTSTVQIQVEQDEKVIKTEEVISLSEVMTQTYETSMDTSTQTGIRETKHVEVAAIRQTRNAEVASHHLERRVQQSVEARPVQNTRATATYNSVKKDMGTQFITREYEKKMHRRRDVTLTSSGTYTDVTTRTSSTTQTMITPRVQSGLQLVPQTSSIGVSSHIQPTTAIGAVNTLPTDVRSVPVQHDAPKLTSKPIQKDPAPTSNRAISPNTIEKLEDEIIEQMRTQLTSQIREQVETEYVAEILPTLVEEALREKAALEERSRPKSRDAVTSPMRGRSMERSLQHTEQWPFTSTDAPESKKLGEREKQVLRENTKKELRNELRPEVKREVEKEVRETVAREVEKDVRRQVARDVEQSVRQQVAENVKNDVIREMKMDMRDSVKQQVALEVRNELKEELTDKMRTEVRHDLAKEYKRDVFDQEEHKIKEEITKTVRRELKPQLREEIEKELREDITREIQIANLSLITPERPVLVDKDTATTATKSRVMTTQVEQRTNNQGFQVAETKLLQAEKIGQTQPVIMERGTLTQRRVLADFSTSIAPKVSDTGVSHAFQLPSKTFSAQMDQPTVEQKHHSDQYVYMAPRVEEATQVAVWNVTADSILQATLAKADKSVFSSFLPSSRKLPDLSEMKEQETQVQTSAGKSAHVQTSNDRTYNSAAVQFEPDTKHASFGTNTEVMQSSTQLLGSRSLKDFHMQKNPSETFQHRSTSPERKKTSDRFVEVTPIMRDGSVSPILLPNRDPPTRSMKSAQMQTSPSKDYTSSSMQFQPETKDASVGSKFTAQQTSTQLQTRPFVKDFPVQIGRHATFKDRSTSPERSRSSDKSMQMAPNTRDGSVSPVKFSADESKQTSVTSSQMQTAEKSYASSSMQFQAETKHASTESMALVKQSAQLQTERSVRDFPIQMGSRATYKDRSTSPERAASTSNQSIQMAPMLSDGSVSPIRFPADESKQRLVKSSQIQTSTEKNYSSSSMQCQPHTKHAATESAIQRTSAQLQTSHSVRDVPIQMGSQATYKDSFTSPRRELKFEPVMRDGSVSPILASRSSDKKYSSSAVQFQPETKTASVGSKAAVQSTSTQLQTERSLRDVPIQMGSQKTFKDSSTSAERAVIKTSQSSMQITPTTRDGSVSPVTLPDDKLPQKSLKSAQIQASKDSTSSSMQFQPETKTAAIGSKAAVQNTSTQLQTTRSVRDIPIQMGSRKTFQDSSTSAERAVIKTSQSSMQIAPTTRDGSVSPVMLPDDKLPQKSLKSTQVQASKDSTSSSMQFQAETKTASVGAKAAVQNTSTQLQTTSSVRDVPIQMGSQATLKDSSTSVERAMTNISDRSMQMAPTTRDESVSAVIFPGDKLPQKSLKSAQIQASKDSTSSSMQFQPETKTASIGSTPAVQNTSTQLQTARSVRDIPIQMGSRKTFQDSSTSAERAVIKTSQSSMQIAPTTRDGSVSPVMLSGDKLPQKSLKSAQIQASKDSTSSSMQFQPETKTALIGSKAAVHNTSTQLQTTRSVRDIPIQMGSRPKLKDSSTSAEHVVINTSDRSMQMAPTSRDGSISPVMLPEGKPSQKSVKTAHMQASRDSTTSSMQFQAETKTASIESKASVQNSSTHTTRSVRDVPIQMGSQSTFKDRSTSPKRELQFKPVMRDGSISPILSQNVSNSANAQTSTDKKYSSSAMQFQPETKTASVGSKTAVQSISTQLHAARSVRDVPIQMGSHATFKDSSTNAEQAAINTNHRSMQMAPTTRDGSVSPVMLPDENLTQKSFKSAQIQASKDSRSSSIQFQAETKTASIGSKTAVQTTSTQLQTTRSVRDVPIQIGSKTTYKNSSTNAERVLTDTSNRSIQKAPTTRDGSISPVVVPDDKPPQKTVKSSHMQTSAKNYASSSMQIQPDRKNVSTGSTTGVQLTSTQLQTTRSVKDAPIQMIPQATKDSSTAPERMLTNTSNRSMQFEPTVRDGSISPVMLPSEHKSVSSAQKQTSTDKKYTSASMYFQPNTKVASVGPKPVETNTFNRSSSPVDQKVRSAHMQTQMNKNYTSTSMHFQPDTTTASVGPRSLDPITSSRSMQFRPIMHDGSNSPVDLPTNQRSIRSAQMQTQLDKTSTSMHFHPNTTVASVGPTPVVAKTSDRLVQIEPIVRDGANSPVDQPYDKQLQISHDITPGSPDLDQRRKLSTIEEEPVKLSRTTNLQQSSFVRTSRLDEELYNLLKQAEKLGSVRRLPSSPRKAVVTCVASPKATSQLVAAVTTMMQQMPPRCRVVILQQSAPGVTYTTAIFSATTDRPTMSTGFYQSMLSTKSSSLPALFGPTREPMVHSDPESHDDPQQTTKSLQRTQSVRFADQDRPLKKHETRANLSYTSTKKTTKKSTAVSNQTYGFSKTSPRGITSLQDLTGDSPPELDYPTPRPSYLASKPGIEGDVDTEGSETDSEPQLKSILRKPASHTGKGSSRRTDTREEGTTDSDGSSVCDQYDISGRAADDSSLPKLPSLSSISRGRGDVKQDLSMSGVIQSSQPRTTLTGYRQYDSTRVESRTSKGSASKYQRPVRDYTL